MKHRQLLSIAVALLVSATASECEKRDERGEVKPPNRYRCDVHGDEPHQSSFDPKTIASKAWVRCTVPADRATVIVKLQKREPGGWVDMITDDDDWRNLAAGKKYIVRTAIGCDYGTYRTAAKGWGRYKGEESGMKDWGYSRTRKDPCMKK